MNETPFLAYITTAGNIYHSPNKESMIVGFTKKGDIYTIIK